jgi:transcriptional regulator with XRE-family HTH domain
MPKKPTIGEVLKRARQRKNLTADDVAALCNVSRSRVYLWEASDFVLPKNFAILSKVLGISERRLRSLNGDRFLIAA